MIKIGVLYIFQIHNERIDGQYNANKITNHLRFQQCYLCNREPHFCIVTKYQNWVPWEGLLSFETL